MNFMIVGTPHISCLCPSSQLEYIKARDDRPQSTHRVATAVFRRTFQHDGKISPGAGEGCGCTPTPFHYIYQHVYKVAVYAPAERQIHLLTLFHLYQYMYSVVSNLHVQFNKLSLCLPTVVISSYYVRSSTTFSRKVSGSVIKNHISV
jgi:hypothetical protein